MVEAAPVEAAEDGALLLPLAEDEVEEEEVVLGSTVIGPPVELLVVRGAVGVGDTWETVVAVVPNVPGTVDAAVAVPEESVESPEKSFSLIGKLPDDA